MSRIETFAREVWDVATRKGMLFVTDPQTQSDSLVGFFVPAAQINALGKALVQQDEVVESTRGMFDATRPFVAEPFDETDKWITITGPEELELRVDYDDVNHDVIERLVPVIVDYLNSIPRTLIEDASIRGNQARVDREGE